MLDPRPLHPAAPPSLGEESPAQHLSPATGRKELAHGLIFSSCHQKQLSIPDSIPQHHGWHWVAFSKTAFPLRLKGY